MLKHVLLASVLLTGSTFAADTHPVEASGLDCRLPNQSGATEARVSYTVTAGGAVEGVSIVKSSGNANADAQIVKCFEHRTYTPATHDGTPIAFHVKNEPFAWGRLADMEGDRYAFAKLEQDADHRCRKLFPINPNFMTSKTLSIVTVTRVNGGEPQFAITQSANETADGKAVACLKKILPDHAELPATFARGIAVDWAHR